jgi:hypothetical protein
MGRDQETCEFDPGEDLAEERILVANDLAALAGFGAERFRLGVPPPGLAGPAQELAAFREGLSPSPLGAVIAPPADLAPAGMDRALVLLRELLERPDAAVTLPPDVAGLFGPEPQATDTLLWLGDWVVLDRLLSLVVNEWRLGELFADAARLLRREGIAARPVVSARAVRESGAERVVTLCDCCVPDFGRPVETISLDRLVGADGRPVAGAGATGFRFRISPEERTELALRLLGSERVRCTCPGEVAQFRVVAREGAWRPGRLAEPYLAFSDLARAEAETPAGAGGGAS